MSCLDLWVAAFDRLSEAIEDWDSCCNGVGDPPAGTEDVVTYDDTDIIADNTDVGSGAHPVEFPTLSDFQQHQCGLAKQFAASTDDLIDRIEGIATTAQNVIVFATLVVLAYANVIGMAVAAILAGGYAMVTASEIFGAASAFSELRDLLHRGDPFGADEAKIALSARYDDIVDAIYCANDATEAAANLRAILDDELTGPLLVLAKLMWSTPMLRLAFEFSGTVTPASDCVCDTQVYYDFTNLGSTEDGVGPWNLGDGTLRTTDVQLDTNEEINLLNQAWGSPVDISLRAYVTLVDAGRSVRLSIDGDTLDTVGPVDGWVEHTVSGFTSTPYDLRIRNVGGGGPIYVSIAEVEVTEA